jgi:hypothetical protein
MKEPLVAVTVAVPSVSPDAEAVTVMVPGPVAWTIAKARPPKVLRVFPRNDS